MTNTCFKFDIKVWDLAKIRDAMVTSRTSSFGCLCTSTKVSKVSKTFYPPSKETQKKNIIRTNQLYHHPVIGSLGLWVISNLCTKYKHPLTKI